MTQPYYLIREQDLQAYVDGQLAKTRRRAVERFLADRDISLDKAIEMFRANLGLNRYRDKFYEDTELKAEVDRLMKRHCKTHEEHPPHGENVVYQHRRKS